MTVPSRLPPPPPSRVSAPAAAVRRTLAPKLRWYQSDLKAAAIDAWARHGDRSNVLAVLPCGGGKTVFFGSIISEEQGSSICIAHRQELIAQISQSLARFGVRHRIIAPDPLVRAICAQHLEEFGVVYYDPTARAAVASVQSLTVKRVEQEKRFIQQVRIWVQDEAHHVVRGNQWGRAAEMFPNARGLGVTATPIRSDGKGLGRQASGVFDVMVTGPSMRELIDGGYLCDYRVIVAETHIDMAGVNIGTDGDYVLDRGKGKAAVRGSTLVGDVVSTYLKYTPGMLGLCFTSDLETAEDIAAQFRAAGVPAKMVDGTTPDAERRKAMREFKRRELMVLTNVGLFGEGLDLAGVEVVMGARKTTSFNVHAQQFSRMGRLDILAELMYRWDEFTPAERKQFIAESRKPRGTYIDHVGNCLDPRLGLPDCKNDWSLDDQERKSSGPTDAIPLVACMNCASPYERFHKACPYCGTVRLPAPGRTGPSAVDGDMTELPEAMLAALRAAVAEVAMPNDVFRQQADIRKLPSMWAMRRVNLHDEHRRALLALQDALAWWGGEHRALGRTDSEIFRRFFLTFGTDWLTCQAQDRPSMEKLTAQVVERLSDTSRQQLTQVSA